jgi:hypothetical protein
MMMSEVLEAKDAIGKLHQGVCFGRHHERAGECGECQVAVWCKPATERKKSGREPLPPVDPAKEPAVEPIDKVDPLDYLLKTLKGKYEQKISRSGDMTQHVFTESGKPVIVVAIKGAAVQFKTAKFPKGKVVKTLESTEQVEAILGHVI